MKQTLITILLLITGVFARPASATQTLPDAAYTPGSLCTDQDPNFMGYYYAEQIARCKRNVSTSEKREIAAHYGNIPEANWPGYEFDHYIPLCAGGSDDISNVWPQPHGEALGKDKLENDVCIAMRAGTMTQAEAVQKMHDWFNTLQARRAAAAAAELTED